MGKYGVVDGRHKLTANTSQLSHTAAQNLSLSILLTVLRDFAFFVSVCEERAQCVYKIRPDKCGHCL